MIKQSKLQTKVFRLIRKKDFLTALELIEQERLNAKNSSFYYALYGIIHIYMERFHEAKLFIDKAIAINPVDTIALNGRAFVLLKENKLNAAIQVYVNILTINPDELIVKRNLRKFKTQRSSDKALESLNPDSFFRSKTLYLFKYQKVIFYTLIGIMLSLFSYKLLSLEYFNLDGKRIFSLRDHYSQKIYVSRREIENKLDLITSSHSNKLRVLTLNELLVSNLNANQKIKLEHLYRRQYLLAHSLRPDSLQETDLNQIIAFPQKYHGLPIQLAGSIRFEEKTNSYSLKTINGLKLTLSDRKKLLKNIVSLKNIKIVANITSLSDKPVFEVISIE